MFRRHMSLLGLLVAALLLAPMTATAAPSYQIRTDGSGIPLILQGSGGHSSVTMDRVKVTNDGYAYAYDDASSGYEYHIMSPGLESPNNAAVSGQVALVRYWDASREMYEASVSSSVKTGLFACRSGFTRTMPNGAFFHFSGDSDPYYAEVRFEADDGTYDATNSKGARRADGREMNRTVGYGYHKSGLALMGETGLNTDTWNVLIGVTPSGGTDTRPITTGVLKTEWGPLTGWNPGTPAAGTRTITGGGWLVGGSGGTPTSFLQDLVLGVSDQVNDCAYNPLDGNVYFISTDTTAGKVYLSAAGFTWGNLADDSPATYVNLDPDTADNHIELTYDSGDADPDLLQGWGLGFSPSGDRLYVANGSDRIWQFDLFEPPLPIPEPGGLGLMLLGVPFILGRRKRGRKMSRKWMSFLGLVAVALLLAPMAATAAPVYNRVEVAGVPQVLRVQTSTAFSNTQNSGRIAYHLDNDRIYWSDHRSSGHSFFWLDPTATGDLGGSHESCTGSVRSYTVGTTVYAQTYAGTVSAYDPGGTPPVDNRSPLNSGNVGMAYLPAEQTVVTMVSTGNGDKVHEIRAAASVGGVDVLGEGTVASRVDTAQHCFDDGGVTTGNHKSYLAYLGDDGTDYQFLFIDSRGGLSQNGKTLNLSITPTLAPTASTEGTRSNSVTSGTVSSAQLNDLVPTASDVITALANDASGNVYVLSATGGSNYVTAFSLGGGFNQLDLDPDDDNGAGSMYLDLTGLITNTAGDTNMNGHGLAVNGDASLLYIAANADAAEALHDNIFIFEKVEPALPIPEPAGLGLMGLALLAIRRKRS